MTVMLLCNVSTQNLAVTWN